MIGVLVFIAGVVVGVFTAVTWAVVWAAGDLVVDFLLEPGFDAHTDQAIANSREREVSA